MILDVGSHEETKALLHGAAALLFGIFAIYNAAALIRRRRALGEWQPHLAVNTALDLIVVAVEIKHAGHHVDAAQ